MDRGQGPKRTPPVRPSEAPEGAEAAKSVMALPLSSLPQKKAVALPPPPVGAQIEHVAETVAIFTAEQSAFQRWQKNYEEVCRKVEETERRFEAEEIERENASVREEIKALEGQVAHLEQLLGPSFTLTERGSAECRIQALKGRISVLRGRPR